MTTKMFEAKKLRDVWLSHKTIHKMMEHRQDTPVSYAEPLTWDEYTTQIQSFQSEDVESSFYFSEKFKKTIVYWVQSVDAKCIGVVSQSMDNEGYKKSLVVVLDSDIKNQDLRNVATFKASDKKQAIELYQLKLLTTYIFDNNDLHEVCSNDKMEEVLKVLRVDKSQLQTIKKTDPACRFIGAKKGQLVMITQTDKDVSNIVFRLVI